MATKNKSKTLGLDAIIANHRKESGDDAIIEGDEELLDENYPRISTGILDLDEKIGGGFPKGRIVDIYGENGSGKCLPKDTYIWTECGLMTIEEIFNSHGLQTNIYSDEHKIKFGLLNKYNKIENTIFFTRNGKRPVVEFVTRTGRKIRSTKNHPHMIMDENAAWSWRKTQDLKIGDFFVTSRTGYFNTVDNANISLDEFYALGVLIADGSLTREGRLSVTNDDPYILEFMKNFLNGFGKVHVYHNNDNNSEMLEVNAKKTVLPFYERVQLGNDKSSNKRVPLPVRTGSKTEVRAFLRGYFDCECYINADSHYIEVSSASNKLLEEIKLLLEGFGIISTIKTKVVKQYPDNDYWTLLISGYDFNLFLDEIGFDSIKRNEQVKEATLSFNHQDTIPNINYLIKSLFDSNETDSTHVFLRKYYANICKVTYTGLDQILDLDFDPSWIIYRLKEIREANYYYDEIVEINYLDPEPTFDFTMEETHSFVANGIVTHNTGICYSFLAQAQKHGRCIFIDLENTYDARMAALNGVDTKSLILVRIPEAENIMTFIDECMQTGEVAAIVVDSIAGMTPAAELAGDIGDSHVGLIGRVLSQGLRIITKRYDSDTIVVFVNQLRANIGAMGNAAKSIPTGGRAVKFYSSTRLKVSRIGKIEAGGEVIGHEIKVDVDKSKLSKPFQVSNFQVIYDVGFNNEQTLIEWAAQAGVLKKNGAWITDLDSGEQIAQGMQNACDRLRDEPELYQSVYDRTMAARSKGS